MFPFSTTLTKRKIPIMIILEFKGAAVTTTMSMVALRATIRMAKPIRPLVLMVTSMVAGSMSVNQVEPLPEIIIPKIMA